MVKTKKLLAAALLVALAPAIHVGEAAADWTKDRDGLVLGVSKLANPIDPTKGDGKQWHGSYVYYGKYFTDRTKDDQIGTVSEPVRYRVLAPSTTDFSDDKTKPTPTMLLDCDKILYRAPFSRKNGNLYNYKLGKKYNLMMLVQV